MCFSETHTHTHTHICSKQIIFAGCRVVRVCTGLSSKEDIVKIAVFPAGSSCFLLFFLKFVASEGFMRVLWSFFLLMTRVLLLRAECEQLWSLFLRCFELETLSKRFPVIYLLVYFPFVNIWSQTSELLTCSMFTWVLLHVSASLSAVWTLHRVGPEPFAADTGGILQHKAFCCVWCGIKIHPSTRHSVSFFSIRQTKQSAG